MQIGTTQELAAVPPADRRGLLTEGDSLANRTWLNPIAIDCSLNSASFDVRRSRGDAGLEPQLDLAASALAPFTVGIQRGDLGFAGTNTAHLEPDHGQFEMVGVPFLAVGCDFSMES